MTEETMIKISVIELGLWIQPVILVNTMQQACQRRGHLTGADLPETCSA
jgi:hypothetical protein